MHGSTVFDDSCNCEDGPCRDLDLTNCDEDLGGEGFSIWTDSAATQLPKVLMTRTLPAQARFEANTCPEKQQARSPVRSVLAPFVAMPFAPSSFLLLLLKDKYVCAWILPRVDVQSLETP